uniref:Uncharacterized protein n=1 Tax=Arundo donax TaxID=35708 RepID=A0A0A9G847_ARUDO
MAGACAVAVATVATAAAPPLAAEPNSNLALLRVSCRQNPRAAAPAGARNRAARGRARLSRRDPAEAETEAIVGRILKDDSSYLWTLVLGIRWWRGGYKVRKHSAP